MPRHLAVLFVVNLTFLAVAISIGHMPPVTEGDGRLRETPLALGQVGQVGDYAVKVVSVTSDATTVVLAQNLSNVSPVPGNVFFMVRVKMAYTGEGTEIPWLYPDFSVVGTIDQAYSLSNSDCGVIPDSIVDAPASSVDGIVFNVCWSVPQTESDSLVMCAEPRGPSQNTDIVWFSLTRTRNRDTHVPATPDQARIPIAQPSQAASVCED
jgi:hypothetical protein